jgi:hypothetical protein
MNNHDLNQLIISKYLPQDGLFPILDGIIDESYYNKSKQKILWILWEPYDDYNCNVGANNPCQKGFYNKEKYLPGTGGWDCRNDIVEKTDKYLSIRTWKTIAKICSRVLYENDFDTEINLVNSIKSIACININKYPAGHTSSNRWSFFENLYSKCGEALLEQINYIKSQIIIGGNIVYLFKKDIELNDSIPLKSFRRNAFINENRLFLDALHPSRKSDNYINEVVSGINELAEKST